MSVFYISFLFGQMYNKHAVHRCAPISAIAESDRENFSLHKFIFMRYSKMAEKSVSVDKCLENSSQYGENRSRYRCSVCGMGCIASQARSTPLFLLVTQKAALCIFRAFHLQIINEHDQFTCS